jgi:hypothetical protein
MKGRRTRKEWEAFLDQVKEALGKMGIEYRETSRIRKAGGLCVVRGRKVMIVNRFLDAQDKADLVRKELSDVDLDGLFLRPEVRDFFGG